MTNSLIHIDVSLLRFLADTVLPMAAALVARRFSNETVKSGILTVLAFIMAIVQDLLIHNGDFVLVTFLGNFLTALVIGFLTHQFVWKPIGVTGDSGWLMKLMPHGIGRPDPNAVEAHTKRVNARLAA